jgi:hypothetical protein
MMMGIDDAVMANLGVGLDYGSGAWHCHRRTSRCQAADEPPPRNVRKSHSLIHWCCSLSRRAKQRHLEGRGRQSVPDHGKAHCYHDKQCPDEHGDAAQAKIVEHGSPHSQTMAKDTRILGRLNTRGEKEKSANPSNYMFEFPQ